MVQLEPPRSLTRRKPRFESSHLLIPTRSSRTPHSSISHRIVATLYPTHSIGRSIITSQPADILRYSPSDEPAVSVTPILTSTDSPTRIEVQVPRTTYHLGDVFPIYVTVPVPTTHAVVDEGLRLRSIRAELVRSVHVLGRVQDAGAPSSVHSADGGPTQQDLPPPFTPVASSSTAPVPPATIRLGSPSTSIHRSTFTRSGAAARFHSSRPVRIRLLLHAAAAPSTPPHHPLDSSNEQGDCPITQHTVLHNVSFALEVYASFLSHSPPPTDRPSTSTSTSHGQVMESTTTLRIPLTVLPPRAPWRSAEQEMINVNEADLEAHYRKKFDKPPERTVRAPDADIIVGSSSGARGSAAVPPPPFEEAPPPFVEGNTGNGAPEGGLPPTFLESQRTAVAPGATVPGYTEVEEPGPVADGLDGAAGVLEDPGAVLVADGEGVTFGFRPEEQFDGLESETIQGIRSASPPPPIGRSVEDADVTAFAALAQGERAALVEALIVAERMGMGREATVEGLAAIAMVENDPVPPFDFPDDPTDPPPGIDAAFATTAGGVVGDDHGPPPPTIEESDRDMAALAHVTSRDGHGQRNGSIQSPMTAVDGRPPPYLNRHPDEVEESHPPGAHEHGTAAGGPPPYVDLVPMDDEHPRRS
jgi:neural Wiskott-Aldrich syndrome protein